MVQGARGASMATFSKKSLEEYSPGNTKAETLDNFAREDGCLKIYESDDGYHVVRRPGDEQAILTSPYVHNPVLVWERH
jgi:hypothetical protein